MRVLVVGAGPVGARLAEELLPAVRSGAIALTVVGAEPVAAYNRVLVAEHAVGAVPLEEIMLQDADELVSAGVDLRLSSRVIGVDTARRTATIDDGTTAPYDLEYDRIVFTTGARANIPTLEGVPRSASSDGQRHVVTRTVGADDRLPRGVTALRDLADAARVADAVDRRDRLVVRVQPFLDGPPVECAPALHQGAEHGGRDALRPVRSRRLLRQDRPLEPPVQIVDDRLRDGYAESLHAPTLRATADSGPVRARLATARAGERAQSAERPRLRGASVHARYTCGSVGTNAPARAVANVPRRHSPATSCGGRG